MALIRRIIALFRANPLPVLTPPMREPTSRWECVVWRAQKARIEELSNT